MTLIQIIEKWRREKKFKRGKGFNKLDSSNDDFHSKVYHSNGKKIEYKLYQNRRNGNKELNK